MSVELGGDTTGAEDSGLDGNDRVERALYNLGYNLSRSVPLFESQFPNQETY